MIRFRIYSRTFFNVTRCLFILEMKYGGKHLIRRIDLEAGTVRTLIIFFHSKRQSNLYLCGWPHKGISGMMHVNSRNEISRCPEGRIGF